MTFKYNFWIKIFAPIDKIFNLFGYYIILRYTENQTDLFDRFSSIWICHSSKLNKN